VRSHGESAPRRRGNLQNAELRHVPRANPRKRADRRELGRCGGGRHLFALRDQADAERRLAERQLFAIVR
jgi:hypothetical protein